MKQILIIVADYNCPMSPGIYRSLTFTIEKFAGGDHYLNFRNYIRMGGMTYFAQGRVAY